MNSSRILIWCSFILIFSCNVLPQENVNFKSWAEIKGNVIDYENKEPLPGVWVTLDSNSYQAATDVDGNYFISKIKPGSYKLEFSWIFYETQSLDSLTLNAGETRTINIEMREWGESEAEKDIRNGDVTILIEGLVALCKPLEIINSLCTEYGFSYVLTGCIPIGADKYNARVYEYLDELNGKGWKEEFEKKLEELCNKKN